MWVFRVARITGCTERPGHRPTPCRWRLLVHRRVAAVFPGAGVRDGAAGVRDRGRASGRGRSRPRPARKRWNRPAGWWLAEIPRRRRLPRPRSVIPGWSWWWWCFFVVSGRTRGTSRRRRRWPARGGSGPTDRGDGQGRRPAKRSRRRRRHRCCGSPAGAPRSRKGSGRRRHPSAPCPPGRARTRRIHTPRSGGSGRTGPSGSLRGSWTAPWRRRGTSDTTTTTAVAAFWPRRMAVVTTRTAVVDASIAAGVTRFAPRSDRRGRRVLRWWRHRRISSSPGCLQPSRVSPRSSSVVWSWWLSSLRTS